jgi:hypothetical protein
MNELKQYIPALLTLLFWIVISIIVIIKILCGKKHGNT